MRALVMDFADDKKCLDINNEFMMGKSILATPILNAQYTPEVIKRDTDANAGWNRDQIKQELSMSDDIDFMAMKDYSFYLPKGTIWYDFEDGRRYDGGQEVTLKTNIMSNPFFVRGGSILPIGPDVQYSTEKSWDEMEVRVYAGANGTFTLYEDEFDNYNYEQGKYTEIEFNWNDKSNVLTIMSRKGGYDGAIENRRFNIVLVDGNKTSLPKVVTYTGKKVSVKL